MFKQVMILIAIGMVGLTAQAQPLARYTFDDGTALDVTGNGYDGILLVNPDDPNIAAEIVQDAERGQALKLNSIGMQLDSPFEITTSLTVSYWAKFESGRYFFEGPFTIRTDRVDTDERDWIEFRYPDSEKVDKFNPKSEENPAGFLDGQWHHYVFVLDSSGYNYVYFDGILLPARDYAVKAHDFGGAMGPIFVGDGLEGYMDDIRIYNYAVSGETVPELMGDLTQPLAQYTFDDGTALDVTGNGYDGFLLVNPDDPNVVADVVDDPNRGQVLKLNSIGMQLDGPFPITTSLTVSYWAKFESGRYFFEGPFTIRTDRVDTDERDWIEFRYPDSEKVDKFNPKSEENPAGFLDGQWHHYVFVLDSSGYNYVYFDGILLPARDYAVKAHDFGGAMGPIFVGDGLEGYMDDIRIYNYVVSGETVPDLMEARLAQYTFDDGTAADVSGNGYDGFLLVNPNDPNVAAEVIDDPNRGQVLKLNSIGMQLDGPFPITTSLTLTAWIKVELPPSGRNFFSGPWHIRRDRQDTDERDWIEFRYPDSTAVDKFNPKSEENPAGFLDGQWHHYAFVLHSSGHNYIYFDGVSLPRRDNDVKAYDFGGAVGPIFVGDDLEGCMDEITLYNVALGVDVITDIMLVTTPIITVETMDSIE